MKRILTALLIAACGLGQLCAQALTSLTGTVSDPSGAVVPGAVVSIVNDDTRARRETAADARGRYSLLQVFPVFIP